MPALLCAALALSFCAPVPASAAVRYARPGGNGPSPCLAADPCSLFVAAGEVPAGERAEAGDEVVVLPGEYSGTGDLGPDERISTPLEIDLHRAAGQPRPVIRFAVKGGGLTLNGWDTASDLELIGPDSWSPLHLSQSTGERLVVRSAKDQGIACSMGFRSLLRDSVCITSGAKAAAAGQDAGTNPWPNNVRSLRSVTAIATGPESQGVLLSFSGGEVTLDVKGTIAKGTAADVEAVGSGAGGGATIELSGSDYATAKAVTKEGGLASVTEAGTDGNVTAPPLLASDLVHQLAGSPTIDHGVVDELSGSFDVDGDARVFEGQPDIGADELAPPPPPVSEGSAGSEAPAGTPSPVVPAPPHFGTILQPPGTTLMRKPPRRTGRHRATFTFASSHDGGAFQCKLDGRPYRACRSPFKVTVGKGRHVFRVRALAAGVPDPTPAVFRWRVLG